MATKKTTKRASTPPTGTTVPAAGAAPAASSAVQAAAQKIAEAPSGTGQAIPQSNPIGDLPYYATDPVTGELTPNRWVAVRPEPTVSRIGGEAAGRVHPVGVLPHYYQGDAEAIVTGLPPEVLADLQAKMVALGLYGSKHPNIVYRVPDRDTIAAFSQILTASNASGYTYDEVMQQWASSASRVVQPPEPKPPHAIQVTNAEDLVLVFKDAARNAIGREVSNAEARAWASSFQAEQAAKQEAAFAVQDAEPGSGNVRLEQPMSPTAFTETQLRGTPEYAATRANDQLVAFRKMLAGPFGGGQ